MLLRRRARAAGPPPRPPACRGKPPPRSRRPAHPAQPRASRKACAQRGGGRKEGGGGEGRAELGRRARTVRLIHRPTRPRRHPPDGPWVPVGCGVEHRVLGSVQVGAFPSLSLGSCHRSAAVAAAEAAELSLGATAALEASSLTWVVGSGRIPPPDSAGESSPPSRTDTRVRASRGRNGAMAQWPLCLAPRLPAHPAI